MGPHDQSKPTPRRKSRKPGKLGNKIAQARRRNQCIDLYYNKLRTLDQVAAEMGLAVNTVRGHLTLEAARRREELEGDTVAGQARVKDKIVAHLERLLERADAGTQGEDGPAWGRVILACCDRLARLYGLNPDMLIRINLGAETEAAPLVPVTESPAARRLLERMGREGIALPGPGRPDDIVIDAEVMENGA